MLAKYFDFRFYKLVFESLTLKHRLLNQTTLLCKTRNTIDNVSSNLVLIQKHNMLLHYHAVIKQAEHNISKYNFYLRDALDSEFHTYCQLGNQFEHFATMLQNVKQLKMEYNTLLKLYRKEVKQTVKEQEQLVKKRETLTKHVKYISIKLEDRLSKIARYNKQV